MAIIKFSDWNRAVFRCGKDIKGLRGGVHRYAAQVGLQIDAATSEKAVSGWKLNSIFRGALCSVTLVVTVRHEIGRRL